MTKSLKCGKIREAHKASLGGKEERITNIVKLARPRNAILLSVGIEMAYGTETEYNLAALGCTLVWLNVNGKR